MQSDTLEEQYAIKFCFKLAKNATESSGAVVKNVINKMCLLIIYIYIVYMYKEDLALNNLQWLICHKTKLNQMFFSIVYKVSVNIFTAGEAEMNS